LMEIVLKITIFAMLFACGCAVTFVCAAVSFALANLRFAPVARDAAQDAPASRLANHFLKHPNKVAAVSFIASKTGFALSGAAAICAVCYFAWDYAVWWEIVLFSIVAFGLTALAQYAFCDLPASALAGKNPRRAFLLFSGPFFVVYVFIAPLEFFARAFSKKIFGRDFFEDAGAFDYSDVEVALMARQEGAGRLPRYSHKIIRNAVRLVELDTSDVMLPRGRVKFLDTELSLEENLAAARTGGHSRYPLCKGNLDECYGVVHIKDLFMRAEEMGVVNLMDIRHEIIRLKENDPLITALPKLLKYELHMAFVEDEFGGIMGVVTLDDILGELVGEIKDEFDASGVRAITALGKNKYKILGLAPLHKVEDILDIDFDTDDASTFGGLITMSLGRFPSEGERIYFKEQKLRVTVDKVGKKRVLECTAKLEDDEDSTKQIKYDE